MRADDLAGAIWLPGDGRANPTDLTFALARGARDQGATIRERTRVTGILRDRRAVTGVRTGQGDVEAEFVVNCAGQWAKQVGAMGGVTVPLHSAEHFYVVTDQVDGAHRDLPVLRDQDGYIYVKEEVGGLLVGGFEPVAKPWVSPDALPYPFEFQLLEEDWDHFSILMENGITRIPALAETGIKKFYNGPESFTPDGQFILGEAPELRNFFVAAGFNSFGIASAGGAGRALAEWITAGEPGMDLSAVDIRRFAAFNGNTQWLHDRVSEVLGLHYAMPWPNRELTTARPFRRSPAYHLLQQANACFGAKMGWERANFFAPPGEHPVLEYAWGRPNWQPFSDQEQRAARTAVAVFDQTSFAKYLVTGRDAEQVLQWLCTNDVAVEPGRAVYTGMLNARGTYEADITVTRLTRRGVSPGQQLSQHRTRPGPHPQADPRRRARVAGRRHLRLRRLRRHGPTVPGPAVPPVPRRPRRRGVPVRHQPRDRPGLRHRPRHPDHLRRRARLGAVRPARLRRRRL